MITEALPGWMRRKTLKMQLDNSQVSGAVGFAGPAKVYIF